MWSVPICTKRAYTELVRFLVSHGETQFFYWTVMPLSQNLNDYTPTIIHRHCNISSVYKLIVLVCQLVVVPGLGFPGLCNPPAVCFLISE